jgi:GntR family transcriptional regulator
MYIHNTNGGDRLRVIISNSSGQPIYEQIVSQIKAQILSGELSEGDALPSMRLLAKELRISVITTKRAYEELEREGFITTVTGKGSFIAGKNLELVREQRLKEIEEHMLKVLQISESIGIGFDELKDMLETLYQSGKE